MTTPPEVTLVPNNSLITATPEEGRQLAVTMARLIIKLTQPDETLVLLSVQSPPIYPEDNIPDIYFGNTNS